MQFDSKTIRQRNEAIIGMLENGENDLFIAKSVGTTRQNVAGFRKSLGLKMRTHRRNYREFGKLVTYGNRPAVIIPATLLPEFNDWKLDNIDKSKKQIILSYR